MLARSEVLHDVLALLAVAVPTVAVLLLDLQLHLLLALLQSAALLLKHAALLLKQHKTCLSVPFLHSSSHAAAAW